MIAKAVLLLVCWTGSHFACAQFRVEKSIKLLLYGEGKEPGIVSAGDKGAIVYAEAENFVSGNKRKWEVINLNSDFELNWKTSFESEPNFGLKQVKYFDGFIYLMFEDLTNAKKSILFVRTDIDAHNFEYFKIEDFLPKEIADFEILGNSLFLIGTVKKSTEILKFQYGDIRPEVLKGLYTEYNEILDIAVLPDIGVIQIISRVKKNKSGKSLLVVKQFDENGNIAKDIKIESSKGHDLLNARAHTATNGNICIVGTFASGGSKQSTGIFSMVHQENQAQQVYYYNYTNLHHFFEYLSIEDQEKLTRKHQNEGDSKAVHKANHQPGTIKLIGNQWVYTGEIIKSVNTYYSYKNHIGVEYREYSHAVLLGVAESGKLSWDNVIKLNDLSSIGTNQQVYMEEFEGNILTYHLDGPSINYQQFGSADAEAKDGILLIEVEDKEQFDPDFEINAAILPWYGNNFMTYGSFSSGIGSDQNKNIFYINKVSINSSTEDTK